MEKRLSLKNREFLLLVRASFTGIIVSLIALLAFALVLKFVVLGDNVISVVNQTIKAVSIFIAIITYAKHDSTKLAVKSLLIGLVYAVFSYLIFSILSGHFAFNLSTFTDILFALLTAFICGLIHRLVSKK